MTVQRLQTIRWLFYRRTWGRFGKTKIIFNVTDFHTPVLPILGSLFNNIILAVTTCKFVHETAPVVLSRRQDFRSETTFNYHRKHVKVYRIICLNLNRNYTEYVTYDETWADAVNILFGGLD